jgi:hypothetical protein
MELEGVSCIAVRAFYFVIVVLLCNELGFLFLFPISPPHFPPSLQAVEEEEFEQSIKEILNNVSRLHAKEYGVCARA